MPFSWLLTAMSQRYVGHARDVAIRKRKREDCSFCTSCIFKRNKHSRLLDKRNNKETKHIWEKQNYNELQYSLIDAIRNDVDAILWNSIALSVDKYVNPRAPSRESAKKPEGWLKQKRFERGVLNAPRQTENVTGSITSKPVSLYHRPCNRKKLAKEEEEEEEEQVDLRVVEGKSIADSILWLEVYLIENQHERKKKEGKCRKTSQWPVMILFVESPPCAASLSTGKAISNIEKEEFIHLFCIPCKRCFSLFSLFHILALSCSIVS